MSRYDSFEDYVKDKFYNEIYGGIQRYIFNNKDRMDLHSYTVPEVRKFEIDTFDVKGATFKESPGMDLKFDVSVFANIGISGRGKYDWEDDIIERWFRLIY